MKPYVVILVFLAFVAVIWWLPDLNTSLIENVADRFGPVAIVILVAIGIVISPIPSGAVAMVAGAFYGTYTGGALTIAGAVLGAGCAFLMSRHFGRDWVASIDFPLARTLTRERSQNALMFTVLATRLVPFISFDAISYVAGLTPLAFWRFIGATAVGTAPVCIAFAAAGDTAMQGAIHPVTAVLLGGVTLLLPAVLLAARYLRPASISYPPT